MTTPQKEALVAAIRENISKAQSLYLTDFTGVTVNQMETMRRKLREVEAEYKVVKNTLLKIALADTPYAEMGEGLVGQTGITFGYGDPAAPARVLRDMIKDIDRNQIKSIAYEQQVHDAEFLKKLASLPTREVQLQILLGTMMAPIASFARLVNAIKEKLEEEGAETPAEPAPEAEEAAPAEEKIPAEAAPEAETEAAEEAPEEAAPQADATEPAEAAEETPETPAEPEATATSDEKTAADAAPAEPEAKATSGEKDAADAAPAEPEADAKADEKDEK